jgi:hypothetical protein
VYVEAVTDLGGAVGTRRGALKVTPAPRLMPLGALTGDGLKDVGLGVHRAYG